MKPVSPDGPLRVRVVQAAFPDMTDSPRATAEVGTTPGDAASLPQQLRRAWHPYQDRR